MKQRNLTTSLALVFKHLRSSLGKDRNFFRLILCVIIIKVNLSKKKPFYVLNLLKMDPPSYSDKDLDMSIPGMMNMSFL